MPVSTDFHLFYEWGTMNVKHIRSTLPVPHFLFQLEYLRSSYSTKADRISWILSGGGTPK